MKNHVRIWFFGDLTTSLHSVPAQTPCKSTLGLTRSYLLSVCLNTKKKGASSSEKCV